MTVFRTHSVRLVDAIINHPTVRPTAQGGDERLSCEELMEDPANRFYACETGIVLFKAEGIGVYEGHIFCLDGGRGRHALKLGHGALKALFDDPTTILLRADVPMALPAARQMCRALGMSSQYKTDKVEHFTMETYHGRHH